MRISDWSSDVCSSDLRLCCGSTRGWRGPRGMNAGSTMERVYLDLKARIVGGAYPPGTRLDPFHLAKRLAASPTPVREALHRLSGERIVDRWHQDGFRQPIFPESVLCSLYLSMGSVACRETVCKYV